jgi:tRNA-dihydrouridine synthase
MIGRGAIGNPWIFSNRDRTQVAVEERVALLRRHLALNLEFYGARLGLVLFRKHAVKYIQGLPGERALRVPLLNASSLADFDELLAQMSDADLNRAIPEGAPAPTPQGVAV